MRMRRQTRRHPETRKSPGPQKGHMPMTAQNPPLWAARLRAEREARGWSKHEMARQLLRADGLKQGNPTNLARQIYDWEKGQNFPRDWASAYAKAFKLDPSDLFSTGPGKEASSTYDPHHDFEDDEVKRRALLGILATTAAAAPVTQLGLDAERLRAILTGTLTTEATTRDADAWEQVVYGYAREAGFVPPQQVLPEMLADLAELDLLISRATSAARPRLVNAAAHLSMFTAISMLGLGDVRSARRWWRTAIRAADESGDPDFGALARGRHGVLALVDGGNEPFVLHTADQAIALAGRRQAQGRQALTPPGHRHWPRWGGMPRLRPLWRTSSGRLIVFPTAFETTKTPFSDGRSSDCTTPPPTYTPTLASMTVLIVPRTMRWRPTRPRACSGPHKSRCTARPPSSRKETPTLAPST